MQIKRYDNRNGVFGYLLILQCMLPLPALAGTEYDSNCPRAKAVSTEGVRLELGQYEFPDGNSDLGLMVHNANGSEIKRVTYGGGKTQGCRYTSLALLPGGSEEQWGWHLAWSSERGLFYARMDGQAWVSSPPKRFSTASAGNAELQASGQELRLRWQELHDDTTEVYLAVSHDEGRSWETPIQLQPAD